MTTTEWIGFGLTLLLMVVGLIGCVVPALPGAPLVLLAAIGHKLYFGAHGVGWFVMTLLAILTAGSLILEHMVSAYGARRFGATWRGVLGAIIGTIVGVFFGLPGILLGPFAGAALFELAGRRSLEESGRAGVGATLGLLFASIAKLACCLTMIGLFVIDVLVYK